jgi:hypothetical protein
LWGVAVEGWCTGGQMWRDDRTVLGSESGVGTSRR